LSYASRECTHARATRGAALGYEREREASSVHRQVRQVGRARVLVRTACAPKKEAPHPSFPPLMSCHGEKVGRGSTRTGAS